MFSWFLFTSALLQLISLLLWTQSLNNLPLLHLHVAIGFVCLAWFYNTLLGEFISRRIIQVTTAVFVIFTVINSLFFQDIFTFNSYALTVECVLVLILSLSTYMLLLNNIVIEKRKETIKSVSWINSGLFIYYSCTLIIFYYGDIITMYLSPEFSRYTWILHSFFSVVMYTCFIIGLWKRTAR